MHPKKLQERSGRPVNCVKDLLQGRMFRVLHEELGGKVSIKSTLRLFEAS